MYQLIVVCAILSNQFEFSHCTGSVFDSLDKLRGSTNSIIRQSVPSIINSNSDQLSTIVNKVNDNGVQLDQCSRKLDTINFKLSDFRDQTKSKLNQIESKNGQDFVGIKQLIRELNQTQIAAIRQSNNQTMSKLFQLEEKIGHDTMSVSNQINVISDQVRKLANNTLQVIEFENRWNQLETIRMDQLRQIENLRIQLDGTQQNIDLLKGHNIDLSKKSDICELELIKVQKRFDRLFYERDCSKQEVE